MKPQFSLLCAAGVSVMLTPFAMSADQPKAPAAPAAAHSATAPVEKNVTPDEAQKLIQSDKNLVVLDVRTPDEFKDGHIKGAKNIDFFGDDFAKQVDALDKGRPYLVHCAAGGRSAKAVKVLEEKKVPIIYHMNGGMKAWEAAGKPVEK